MIAINLQKKLQAATGKMQLNIALQIEQGTLLTLYGKSGAGKTSVLRMLAGLMLPDSGAIKVQDEIWFDHSKGIHRKTQQRAIGFLFQDYALFPNMTVEENLRFALKKGQSQTLISELIDLMELGDLKRQKPVLLSGGQQQRVALARALVQKPKLLLLDEPLSALDLAMRSKLQDYILEVHRKFGLTTIMVSHDRSEIEKMSDIVAQLENGNILKIGNPENVFPPKNTVEWTGEIIAIQDHTLLLQVGENRVKLKLGEKELAPLRVGNMITIKAVLEDFKIVY